MQKGRAHDVPAAGRLDRVRLDPELPGAGRAL